MFSLGLRGTLIAAGAGAATLEVDRVRQYPGGRWLEIDARDVELTVPLGAEVAPPLDQLAGSTLRDAQEAHAASPRSRSRRTRRPRRSSAPPASSCSAASRRRRSGRTSAEPVELPSHGRGLSILMPVFNERSTVEAAIDDALTAELPVPSRQLVIVDDGSTDGTRELLARSDVAREREGRLPRAEPRQGRGRRTALQHATEEFAAILDADLEYRAADLAHVLEPLVSGEAHVVFGTRAWTSQSSFSFWYVMGNKAVTMATNVLYNCWISDVMTCHKAMRTELFRSLPLRERGFAIEPEIAARVLRAGERIHEVPISYKARAREAGKKLTTIDGLRVLRTLVRCRVM